MYLLKEPPKNCILFAFILFTLCSCEMDQQIAMLANASTVELEEALDSANLRTGNIIHEETFEGSRPLTQFIHRQLAGGHSFTTTTSPVLEGQRAGRFELRKSDPVVTTSGIRAQVLFQNSLLDQLKNEGWYSFGVYFPSNEFTPDDDEESITYWRHSNASAVISLRVMSDRFKFRFGNEIIDLGPVVKDFWHQYVFHIVHSTGSNGLVEVWKNGEKVLTKKGKNSALSAQPQWKIGVYKASWEKRNTNTTKRVVYYDNVKIGNRNATYEEMLPSKSKLSDPSKNALTGPVDLNKGLVGYWKMDEGNGNTLVDHSGNKNNATIVDTRGISWVQGKVGSALRITNSGRQTFSTVRHNSTINITKAVTISAWIKPSVKANKTIVSKAPDGYELSINNAGKLEFWINRDSNGGRYRLQSIKDYPTNGNTWMHVAATFDGSSSIIYINGVADYSAGYGPTPIRSNNSPLVISARNTGNKWEGDLDELRIYNRALSAAEVVSLTGSNPITNNNSSSQNQSSSSPSVTPPTVTPPVSDNIATGLVGHWKMDEGSGNRLLDHSSYNGHATIGNTSTANWVSGKNDKALRLFELKSQIASVPHNSRYDTKQGLTIAAWVRPNAVASKMILSKGWPDGYYLSTFTNGKFEFRINTGRSGTTYRLQSQRSYPSNGNTWVHVAITFDGRKSTMYVNGQVDNSATYPATEIIYNTTALQIGSRNGINRWSGDLDDVRLYNRALSTSEIANLAK